MTRHIGLFGAVLLFAGVAVAQDYTKVETFLGFTYSRMNSATEVPAFSANGGGGQLVVNANRWLGIVADLGAVHNGNIGGYHLDTTFTNFMFGPRISFRRSSRVTPYIHALFGGVYASTSAQVNVTLPNTPNNPIVIPPTLGQQVVQGGFASLRAAAQETAFAQAYGGGIDIKINKWVSFRPIGLDYYMTRLQNLRSLNDNNQNNLRYTTGLNFMLGAPR